MADIFKNHMEYAQKAVELKKMAHHIIVEFAMLVLPTCRQ